MKYGMMYFNTSRHLNDFDEIILKYDHKTMNIVPHAQDKYRQEQRVILNVQQLPDEDFEESFIYMRAAAQAHPEIALMGSINQLPRLKESGLPFFFAEIADSWDKLNGFIQAGVCDVYVGNEFAFNIDNISAVCKRAEVKIRVFANVAQSNYPAVENTMTQFFIRPEDLLMYDDLIDVVEFYGPLDRQDVLYEIYVKGQWRGNLGELIIGVKEDINNTLITPIFGTLRRSCGKRCAYSKSCNICPRFVSIQRTLEEVANRES